MEQQRFVLALVRLLRRRPESFTLGFKYFKDTVFEDKYIMHMHNICCAVFELLLMEQRQYSLREIAKQANTIAGMQIYRWKTKRFADLVANALGYASAVVRPLKGYSPVFAIEDRAIIKSVMSKVHRSCKLDYEYEKEKLFQYFKAASGRE